MESQNEFTLLGRRTLRKGILMGSQNDTTVQPDYKTATDLMGVLPQSAEVVDGHLHVAGVNMVELAREAGTAVYVMDEEQMRSQLRDYRRLMSNHWENIDVCYAGKAFLSKAMVKLVAEENCSLDVSSGGELAVALAADFPAGRIYSHGNNKTEKEIIECIESGVGHIVVDSFEELDRISALATACGAEQSVLLRITPGVKADTHDYITTGAEDSKFGFGLNEGLALEAVKRAVAAPGIRYKGLHMHIGSQIFALNSFSAAIEKMVEFIHQIKVELGADTAVLNTGGGLGVAYGVPDQPATIEEYAQVIVDGIKKACEARSLSVPCIVVEPGRSIVASSGVTLYTVGTVKEVPNIRTYISIDGGMTDNIRTSLYQAHYEAFIANKADQPRSITATIAGKHCESGDIVVSEGPLQSADIGDILCVPATGAYCQSLSSNYNKQVRPGVIWVKGGNWRWVVRRETYDDLLRCDLG